MAVAVTVVVVVVGEAAAAVAAQTGIYKHLSPVVVKV